MVSKQYKHRVAYSLGAVALLFGFGACGDDGGNTNTPDAAPGAPDAAEAEIDAMEACSGHECPGVDTPFALPEGGEIRIEHFQLGPNSPLGGDFTAYQAFAFTSQEPDARGAGGEVVAMDETAGVICVEFKAGNYFDNGKSDAAQAIVNTREYIDVGEDVTITSSNDTVTVLEKNTPGVDPSSSLEHPIIYLGDGATGPEYNTSYSVKVAGTNEFLGLDLAYGESVSAQGVDFEEAAPTLYFPRQFTFTEPTEEVFFAEGGMIFAEGEDQTFSWTYEGTVDPAWPGALAFIGFADGDGQGQMGCFPAGAFPYGDDDTLLVPSEALDYLIGEGITSGNIIVGFFHHMGYEERQTGNRFDLLGINCKSAPFTIEEATTE